MIILAQYPPNHNPSPRFTKEEETELFWRMSVGDAEARELLARSMMGWAFKRAKNLAGGKVDHIELQSLAGYGLLESLDRWDAERGRLSTCVAFGVLSRVRRFRLTSVGPMHVPESEEGTFQEQAAKFRKRAASMDAEVRQGKSRSCLRHETMECKYPGPEETAAYREELRDLLDKYRKALAMVPDARWRDIIRRRHNGEGYREIATAYGVSWQRIRQIYLKAEPVFQAAIKELV